MFSSTGIPRTDGSRRTATTRCDKTRAPAGIACAHYELYCNSLAYAGGTKGCGKRPIHCTENHCQRFLLASKGASTKTLPSGFRRTIGSTRRLDRRADAHAAKPRSETGKWAYHTEDECRMEQCPHPTSALQNRTHGLARPAMRSDLSTDE